MKHLVFTLLAALVFSGAASAQRLMVGVRGGVNFADYSFVPTRIGDTRFTPGAVRAGYDVGFVLRLNLSKHLHLQSELNYAFVNYNVLAENSGSRRIALRTERFEIPVQLGFQFGVLRLFGGALFRVTESERSSVPQLLKVRFNNGDVGVIEDIDPAGELLTIRFDDRTAVYTADLLAELDMAYAMTVHKSQGSEYPAVVLVSAPAAPSLMVRGVLYTAITRARRLLVLVGDDGTPVKMAANDRQQRRYSGLRRRLKEGMA